MFDWVWCKVRRNSPIICRYLRTWKYLHSKPCVRQHAGQSKDSGYMWVSDLINLYDDVACLMTHWPSWVQWRTQFWSSTQIEVNDLQWQWHPPHLPSPWMQNQERWRRPWCHSLVACSSNTHKKVETIVCLKFTIRPGRRIGGRGRRIGGRGRRIGGAGRGSGGPGRGAGGQGLTLSSWKLLQSHCGIAATPFVMTGHDAPKVS